MIIVGIVDSKETAIEIQDITKFYVVACRFREIGKLARLQNIKKHKYNKKGRK